MDECSLECLGVDEVVETSVEVETVDGVVKSRGGDLGWISSGIEARLIAFVGRPWRRSQP